MTIILLRRFLYFGGLAFTLAAFSSAQVLPSATELPTEETAKSWLLSGDPRLVAWGAHDALMAGYRNLIPDLLSVASSWQPLPERDPNHPRPLELSPQQIDEQDMAQRILDLVKIGAGNSRVFELRAPMMVKNDYGNATMKIKVWQKDMDVIGAYARSLRVPTPLFSATEPVYEKALATGHAMEDTAAVCAVLEKMAGLKRGRKAHKTR